MKLEKSKNYSLSLLALFGLLVFSSLISSQQLPDINQLPPSNSTNIAVCDEQLKICIDQYNSLYYDLRNGTNCNSNTFNQLKEKNSQLSHDAQTYKEQADNLKGYKTAFYIISVLLVIWVIIFLVSINPKNKSGRFTNNGRKTGNKTRSQREEKDSW